MSKDELILLRFTEKEITERQNIILQIKNEGSFIDNIYNFFFSKKKELKEVKIIES